MTIILVYDLSLIDHPQSDILAFQVRQTDIYVAIYNTDYNTINVKSIRSINVFRIVNDYA